jgi:hypothetical protein
MNGGARASTALPIAVSNPNRTVRISLSWRRSLVRIYSVSSQQFSRTFR